jgi:hypothetical protein
MSMKSDLRPSTRSRRLLIKVAPSIQAAKHLTKAGDEHDVISEAGEFITVNCYLFGYHQERNQMNSAMAAAVSSEPKIVAKKHGSTPI